MVTIAKKTGGGKWKFTFVSVFDDLWNGIIVFEDWLWWGKYVIVNFRFISKSKQ